MIFAQNSNGSGTANFNNVTSSGYISLFPSSNVTFNMNVRNSSLGTPASAVTSLNSSGTLGTINVLLDNVTINNGNGAIEWNRSTSTGSIRIQNSTITSSVNTGSPPTAIRMQSGTLIVDNSTITATGTNSSAIALIGFPDGSVSNLRVENSSIVATGSSAYAIRVSNPAVFNNAGKDTFIALNNNSGGSKRIEGGINALYIERGRPGTIHVTMNNNALKSTSPVVNLNVPTGATSENICFQATGNTSYTGNANTSFQFNRVVGSIYIPGKTQLQMEADNLPFTASNTGTISYNTGSSCTLPPS